MWRDDLATMRMVADNWQPGLVEAQHARLTARIAALEAALVEERASRWHDAMRDDLDPADVELARQQLIAEGLLAPDQADTRDPRNVQTLDLNE